MRWRTPRLMPSRRPPPQPQPRPPRDSPTTVRTSTTRRRMTLWTKPSTTRPHPPASPPTTWTATRPRVCPSCAWPCMTSRSVYVLILSSIKRRSSIRLFLGIISSMSCDITEAEFSLYNAYQNTDFLLTIFS